MPHLLIVDDEPSTAWALAEGLTDDGYTIDTFRSAEEALQWLQDGHSDLVITDMNLPGMTGLELARKLRRGSMAQPVIIVTAYGTAERRREFERAGVVASFPKPFRLDQLRRAVLRALARPADGNLELRNAA